MESVVTGTADKTGSVKETCHHGIQMSDAELAEYEQAFQDIEDCVGLVMENGEDL